MVYDADGDRFIRHDPDGTATLYLGSMEIQASGQAITARRFYTEATGALVAMGPAASP